MAKHIKELDTYTRSYLDGLERSAQFSYSAQYFWWKKYTVMRDILRSVIKNNKSQYIYILDIGCQVGHDIFKLSDEFKEKNIYWAGTDINTEFLIVANMRKTVHTCHKFGFTGNNMESLCFKESVFDIIICSEVVEHIGHTGSVMLEIKKMLKTGGYCIVSTPNGDNRFVNFIKRVSPVISAVYSDYRKTAEQELDIRKTLSEIPVDEHVNVHSLDTWINSFSKIMKIKDIRRGSLIYGSTFIDNRPCIFILLLIIDRIFDFFRILKRWSYNFFVVMQHG